MPYASERQNRAYHATGGWARKPKKAAGSKKTKKAAKKRKR